MLIHPKITASVLKKKKTVFILYLILPMWWYIEFWRVPSHQHESFERPASYFSETGFSAVAAIRTKHRDMIDLENDLRAVISKIQLRYDG
jgi:hypothetical protein